MMDRLYNPFGLSNELSYYYEDIRNFALQQWVFDLLPGTSVGKWPIGLDSLVQAIEKVDKGGFFNEPLELHKEFFQKCKQFAYDEARRVTE